MILVCVCVCVFIKLHIISVYVVCVFILFILDVKLVDVTAGVIQEKGHTGFLRCLP